MPSELNLVGLEQAEKATCLLPPGKVESIQTPGPVEIVKLFVMKAWSCKGCGYTGIDIIPQEIKIYSFFFLLFLKELCSVDTRTIP